LATRCDLGPFLSLPEVPKLIAVCLIMVISKADGGCPGAATRLSAAIEKASAGKFEVQADVVSSKGYKIADEGMKELGEVETQLYGEVWSQSSI
jgi:hypothetical protein